MCVIKTTKKEGRPTYPIVDLGKVLGTMFLTLDG